MLPMSESWWIGGGVVAAILILLAGRWCWHFARAVQIERARELFRLQHERFEELLLVAAAATGKPRGLTWIHCEIIGDAILARNPAKRIVALVPVVIQFEPIVGSEMEDVPAAREPRTATAVFYYIRGHWHTAGRIVFNLSPQQTITHFGSTWTLLAIHGNGIQL